MSNKIFATENGQKVVKPVFYLFRYFQVTSLVAIVVILSAAGLGLQVIFRNLVLYKAEKDAIGVSTAIRDCSMHQFIQWDPNEKQTLSIPQENLPEFEEHMLGFLVPFNIVKMKIFDTETRIIYSTDSSIIGQLDRDNTKLATALGGSSLSNYEREDDVWDLNYEEQRKNVEIVETYIPIRNPDGKVVGSFEVYKDVTRDLAMANSILIRAVAVLSMIVLGVFTLLVYVIRHAVKTINSGATDLMETNKRLQQEIADRTRAEMETLNMQNKHSNFLSLVRNEFKNREHASEDME